MKIYTIGVYGCTEPEFFTALSTVEAEVFCDIRLRRGMRGRQYSFVNSNYLQAKLSEMGIRYLHRKDLAPSQVVRDLQRSDDERVGTSKRDRSVLGDVFINAFRSGVLAQLDSAEFMRELAPTRNIVLFCVECKPAACHRSLVAEKLQTSLGLEVEHLNPCKS